MVSRCFTAVLPPEISTASRPSCSVSSTCTSSLTRGGNVLADVVGAQRQFAVAAIDQHGELHGTRAAEVAERIESGAHGAAGEQDVVDEHDEGVVDAAVGHRGALERAVRLGAQIVAVERDVE